MKDSLRLVVVLGVICTAAGSLLAFVERTTSDRIAAARMARKQHAIAQVLPASEAPPQAEVYAAPGTPGSSNVFYVTRRDGRLAGAAIEARSPNGYGGDIVLMVGFTPEGAVQAIEVLEQKETPGLGAKVRTPEFKARFAGRPGSGTDWRVRKDGGSIDAITAATISSRAVCEAVRDAVARFEAHRAELQAGTAGGARP